ncbi:MAG TPA: hypothetical protein VF535_09370 [Allosphingosinicella sp.]|jgi:hypothetical protein
MKLSIPTASPLLLLAAACTGAAGPKPLASAASGRCPDVLDYAADPDMGNRRVDFRTRETTVFAAGHSRDPGDEQFGRIAALFAETRPTLVFFEGPDRGVRATADQTIRETGESGYLRFLALRAGIAVRTLEPAPAEQIRMLLRQFPSDQVFLFFVLREAARMRDREQKKGAALDEAVTSLLGRVQTRLAGPDLPMPFTDLAGLERAFRKYWPGRDWRTAEERWFDPKGDDAATGGVFNAAINRADSTNRNRNLVKLIVDAVTAGERPFVVIGGSHVPMVAPALECELRRIRPGAG